MRTLPPRARQPVRLALTLLSTLCLFASFARPLQALEVWRFRSQSHDPPQIVAFSGAKPRYGDNPKVEILAFLPEIDYARFWKFSPLLLTLAFTSFLLGSASTRSKMQSSTLLEKLRERWLKLTDAERLTLKADVDELAAFMAFLEEGETTAPDRPAASASLRIIGEEPHVTSDRLRQAASLVSEGMKEEAAVARVWQVNPGSPEHGERLDTFRRWLHD